MRVLCLFVINMTLQLCWMVSGISVSHMTPIRARNKYNYLSLLEQPIEVDKANQQLAKDNTTNDQEPLNLIFSPTAKQVSDENNKLLESVESGLHHLRIAFNILTKLSHLLQDVDKHTPFIVDKENFTVVDMLDSLNKLIVDGEKQQRVLIQGTAEMLHKLAVPNSKAQEIQAS